MILFKAKEVESGFWKLNRILINASKDMESWLSLRGLDLIITESLTTKDQDDKLGRISSSHREGRAFDIGIRNMSEAVLNSFIEHFEERYNSYGAVSKVDGKRRFIVHRPHGSGPHLHVQIGKDLK